MYSKYLKQRLVEYENLSGSKKIWVRRFLNEVISGGVKKRKNPFLNTRPKKRYNTRSKKKTKTFEQQLEEYRESKKSRKAPIYATKPKKPIPNYVNVCEEFINQDVLLEKLETEIDIIYQELKNKRPFTNNADLLKMLRRYKELVRKRDDLKKSMSKKNSKSRQCFNSIVPKKRLRGRKLGGKSIDPMNRYR